LGDEVVSRAVAAAAAAVSEQNHAFGVCGNHQRPFKLDPIGRDTNDSIDRALGGISLSHFL
jgi:hypothetical protein